MDSPATMASYQRRGNHIIDMLPWFLMYASIVLTQKLHYFCHFSTQKIVGRDEVPAHLQSADGVLVAHTVMLSRVQTMNDDVQNQVHVQEMSNVHNCDHQMVAMLLQPRLEHRRQACFFDGQWKHLYFLIFMETRCTLSRSKFSYILYRCKHVVITFETKHFYCQIRN
jgi:hypothetical protein